MASIHPKSYQLCCILDVWRQAQVSFLTMFALLCSLVIEFLWYQKHQNSQQYYSHSLYHKVDRCLARYSPCAKANNAIPCNTIRYNTTPCNTMRYNAMTCKTMRYQDTEQFHAVAYDAMQYNGIICKWPKKGHFRQWVGVCLNESVCLLFSLLSFQCLLRAQLSEIDSLKFSSIWSS